MVQEVSWFHHKTQLTHENAHAHIKSYVIPSWSTFCGLTNHFLPRDQYQAELELFNIPASAVNSFN